MPRTISRVSAAQAADVIVSARGGLIFQRNVLPSILTRPSKVTRAVIVVGLGLTLWSLSMPVASAHAALDSISPADGSLLQEPPAQIELVFNERLLEASVKVVVSDASGDVVIRDRSIVSGASVTVPWNPELPGDTYTISYRVVSGDGHPITGQSTFTLDIPMSAPATATGEAMPITPAPSASAPDAIATQSTPVVVESPSAPSQSVPLTDWRMIAAIILGTAGGVGIVLWQRRRKA